MSFIWHAIVILSLGFILLRVLGKKTVGQMTGLEIITLLAMASMIGHAMPEHGVLKTAITLCIFVALLITVQFLALKFDLVEKWMMGRASLVVRDGKIITKDLNKLRMSVDQIEAKLREKGISTLSDVKTATIEMSGEIGYELTQQAKPVTVQDLEKKLSPLQNQLAQQYQLLQELKTNYSYGYMPQQGVQPVQLTSSQTQVAQTTIQMQVPQDNEQTNLFDEVIKGSHQEPIEDKLQ